VSANHCRSSQVNSLQSSKISDGVLHGIESIQTIDYRTSSVQSLHSKHSSTKPSTSISYPQLEELINPPDATLSIFTLPSTPPVSLNTRLSTLLNKTRPICTSLSRVDNICIRRTSLSTGRTQEDHVPYFRKKSLDDPTISSHSSKRTTTMTSDNNRCDRKIDEPMEIRVRCIFSRVGEIDTLNERFTAEIFFEASWYEKDHEIGPKYDPQSGHFNPQLVVLNHIGDTLRQEVSST
jgi:hypothetical protein